jgi:hypothetical protein
MRPTDLLQCAGSAGVAEVRGSVSAEEGERFPPTELVPKLLELLRASIVTLGCKQVYDLAVDTKMSIPRIQLADQRGYRLVKKIPIRSTVAHD